MSEREREILEKLNQAWPRMSDIDKGYILCMVEQNIDTEEHAEEKEMVQQ